ncbi:hypothetical protein S7711_11525 [Stachybotrys chartarum IBT 7711]|uniref:Ecp2 effector protein domain-containing protein n=1 Tax=Stachybotrys chartarum (strain CBS 109288 / IBT 7711) TaxID=1280523 RepID=A0A084AEY1_STACB|nr:hypothetical protein S7711_11525 [Stachybotrys chartarum IBT 7711]
MLSNVLLPLAALPLIGSALASPNRASEEPRPEFAAFACYEDEPTDQFCYNPPNGTPQDVEVEDVQFVADYLRAYGAQTRLGRLFNMPAADAPDCGEWSLYSHGTAMAVAKHLDDDINSSVLFADIARTIDGGANATPEQRQEAIIGCLTAGGSLGVQVNASAPAYSAASYPDGYVTDGVLIKIVWSGN